jgi:hypothetical protein
MFNPTVIWVFGCFLASISGSCVTYVILTIHGWRPPQ